MLLTHLPAVLRIDVYATAAIGVAACFGLRTVNVAQH
jgi:hypothetical protein